MSFIVLVFKFMSFIYFKLVFFTWYEAAVHFIVLFVIFICGTICWKHLFPFVLGSHRSQFNTSEGNYFLTLSSILLIYVYFLRASYYLDYCFFVVTCEIRKCESFNFVHFSRMSWLFWVPCNSMWALKSFHQFPGRKKKR